MKRWSVGILLCLAVVLILTGTVTGPVQAAPVYDTVQYYSGTGHWYQAVYVNEGITWGNAKTDAGNHKGYLATIHSAGENDFAFGLIDDPKYWFIYSNAYLGPYLGGYQPDPRTEEPAGGWNWVTDEGWVYTNWNNENTGQRQPDNSMGIEHFLHYFSWDHGVEQSYWNDVANDANIKGYIIEYNTNPVPLPPGVLLLGTGLVGLLGLRRFRKK